MKKDTGYILTIGDTSCDVLVRIPQPGAADRPGPELIAGGTAGNTAVALARLGLSSKLVTELGDDYYGRYVYRQLEENGVDTVFAHIFPGYPTTQVIILLDEHNSPAADWPIADPELFALFRREGITEELIANAAWVHTSGTSAMYANARDVMLHAIDLAVQMGVPLSFDINLRLHREVGSPDGLRSIRYAMSNADVVFGSQAEWCYFEPGRSAEEAARRLLGEEQAGIIRSGPNGAAGVFGGELLYAPAFRVPVLDALGAGDTFDAGFIFARLAGCSPAQCLRWGNAVAALKLMQAGGRRGGPTHVQLDEFLASDPEVIA